MSEKQLLQVSRNGGIAVVAEDHFDTERQAELIEYFASYLHVDGILVFILYPPRTYF